MSGEKKPGHYLDKHGEWKPDRRKSKERRAPRPGDFTHERRNMFRRRADRELFERDHKGMIEDALEDFAEEHGGHL